MIKFLQGLGNIHCLVLHVPCTSCFLHALCLKSAVGPPISCMYPLKSGKVVSNFASSIIES